MVVKFVCQTLVFTRALEYQKLNLIIWRAAQMLALAVLLLQAASNPSTAQVTILPEVQKEEPRLSEVRKRFQEGDRATRRLDTVVDIKLPVSRKSKEIIERILHGYLLEVGAEPIGAYDQQNATFRLEISSAVSFNRQTKVVDQSVYLILYDRSLSQGERPVMRSKTDLQCTSIFMKDYHTLAPPPPNCVREEAHLRETFLRLK